MLRLQSTSEDQSDDDDRPNDDEGATHPPTPAGQDPDLGNLEEDDLDVDQIGGSDNEILEGNWEPSHEQKEPRVCTRQLRSLVTS